MYMNLYRPISISTDLFTFAIERNAQFRLISPFDYSLDSINLCRASKIIHAAPQPRLASMCDHRNVVRTRGGGLAFINGGARRPPSAF